MNSEKIILGIDPGTSLMGYGIIEIKNKKPILLSMGVIHLAKIIGHENKLKRIFDRVCAIIEEYCPDEMAIEAPFFGKNVQSMLKLGRAQGVAIAAALNHDVPYVEYAPRKIKQSVTGNGNASKEQVAAMLQSMFSINKLPTNLDATDGLAAAVCHHFQSNSLMGKKGYTGWKAFLTDNPKRAK